MKNTITTYVILFLITLTTIISFGFISIQLQLATAKNYNASAIDRVQASNFSQKVIEDIESKSITDKYPTTLTDVTLYEDKKEMLVVTEYKVAFPVLGTVKTGTISGYAR